MCILSSLSNGMLSDITIGDMNIFDFYGYLTSNVLLPLGGLLISLFVGWKLGKKNVINEVTNDHTIRFPLVNFWVFLLRYVMPIIILLIFLSGLGWFQ